MISPFTKLSKHFDKIIPLPEFGSVMTMRHSEKLLGRMNRDRAIMRTIQLFQDSPWALKEICDLTIKSCRYGREYAGYIYIDSGEISEVSKCIGTCEGVDLSKAAMHKFDLISYHTHMCIANVPSLMDMAVYVLSVMGNRERIPSSIIMIIGGVKATYVGNAEFGKSEVCEEHVGKKSDKIFEVAMYAFDTNDLNDFIERVGDGFRLYLMKKGHNVQMSDNFDTLNEIYGDLLEEYLLDETRRSNEGSYVYLTQDCKRCGFACENPRGIGKKCKCDNQSWCIKFGSSMKKLFDLSDKHMRRIPLAEIEDCKIHILI